MFMEFEIILTSLVWEIVRDKKKKKKKYGFSRILWFNFIVLSSRTGKWLCCIDLKKKKIFEARAELPSSPLSVRIKKKDPQEDGNLWCQVMCDRSALLHLLLK